ncbi:MAG: sulfatase [Bryobacteraceae bacterium]
MNTITRRHAARLIAGGALAGAAAAAPRRPNFVFILLDDQRWDALGCMGHPFLKTPNIDRIAREGVIFRNFFVTTPLCSPSRASYLTGQYVHTHGVRDNTDHAELSHRLVTWPRLLHDNGYETAYVGKWHMGRDDSPRPGFDRWVSFQGQGQYVDPLLNIDGRRVESPGYVTDLLSGHAAEFLRRKRSKPFALYLAHKAVHGPFTPAERYKDLYSTEPLPRRPNVTGKVSEQLVRNQLRCIQSVDDGVGQVLKALEETGQLDDTVIVYTSDNGYFWGEHGLGDKRWSYEESIRDPFLVRYPKLIKARSTVEADALNIDVAPTMLELAGVRAPAAMEGRSLVPLLAGKQVAWRNGFLIEYFAEKQFPKTPTWRGIREARWKYTHYPEVPEKDELYDLQSDPYEMHNLVVDPAAKPQLERLRERLARM